MKEIASKGQLWLAFLRWSFVTVPFVLLLGFASGRLVPSGGENPWFVALNKPAIMPPNITFPIVWTTLYILMGLALAIVLNARGSRGRGLAILLFVVQLALNLVWSPLFFGYHLITASLAVLAALFLLVAATIWAFGRVRGLAAVLLLPYLLWIGFAGVLLYQVRALNPDAEAIAPGGASVHIEIRP